MKPRTSRTSGARGRAAILGLVAVIGAAVLAGTSANADTADEHGRSGESDAVAANEQVVRQFIDDVLNGHNGDDAASYFTADMQWHGGTLGTITGGDNVAGLMTTLVQAIPDLEADVQEIFGQGDNVVVRLVVSGTQTGPIVGIPASGRQVQWDAIDIYRLEDGKIAEEWAAEDFTALLHDTGTYTAPWIS